MKSSVHVFYPKIIKNRLFVVLTYSYLCKRSLAQCSSVNAGVTFVGKI